MAGWIASLTRPHLENSAAPLNETESAMLHQAATRFLAASPLSRSSGGERLFRYLLDSTLAGRVPREIEISQDVFGRSSADLDDGTSVRVHIHRLRRKLDDFYNGAGAGESLRLHLPKGHYQFRIERRDPATGPLPENSARRHRWCLIAAAVLLASLAGVAGWWLAGFRATPAERALDAVRASAVWGPVLADERRIAIVLGDYFIFAERSADGTIDRLVRVFDVNSPRDLARAIAAGRTRGEEAVDLGLHYLPLGTGNAVRAIAPVLAARGGGSVSNFAVPVSQLGPEMVKYTNLVYLGYLSGLGKLRGPMFSNSRFGIGSSFDEIVDRETGKTYASTTPLDGLSTDQGKEFAIVSSFRGAGGNRVLVIAGTRDASLMQAAEFMTRPDTLAALDRYQGNAEGFEALLAIDSLDNVGLRARIVAGSARRQGPDWSGVDEQPFPDSLDPATAPAR